MRILGSLCCTCLRAQRGWWQHFVGLCRRVCYVIPSMFFRFLLLSLGDRNRRPSNITRHQTTVPFFWLKVIMKISCCDVWSEWKQPKKSKPSPAKSPQLEFKATLRTRTETRWSEVHGEVEHMAGSSYVATVSSFYSMACHTADEWQVINRWSLKPIYRCFKMQFL